MTSYAGAKTSYFPGKLVTRHCLEVVVHGVFSESGKRAARRSECRLPTYEFSGAARLSGRAEPLMFDGSWRKRWLDHPGSVRCNEGLGGPANNGPIVLRKSYGL